MGFWPQARPRLWRSPQCSCAKDIRDVRNQNLWGTADRCRVDRPARHLRSNRMDNLALAWQPELGRPWFELSGFKIYYPPVFFWWWFVYDAYAPQVFVEGAFLASS